VPVERRHGHCRYSGGSDSYVERDELDSAVGWIEQNRRLWTQRFDKLDAHLRDLQRAPSPTPKGKGT
jgi:hypothetical protein